MKKQLKRFVIDPPLKFGRWLIRYFKKYLIDPIVTIGENMDKVPIYGALVSIIIYFIIDYSLMNPNVESPTSVIILSVLIALGILFLSYVIPLQKQTKDNPKTSGRFKTRLLNLPIPFIILVIVSLTFVIFYEWYRGILPTLITGYPKSQVITMLIVAPILEELGYRHFLYGKMAKPDYGRVKGMLLIGLVFIITHPITSVAGFALYWLPTLLFFITYDGWGLYTSIALHICFNLIALL